MNTLDTPSIAAIQEEIVDEFSLFDEWEDRYSYIIDLGKKLPPLPDELKTDDSLVRGCQSRVWLHADLIDGKVHLRADSDAIIVRGLISLILRTYSEHSPEEILEANPDFINKIGMSEHLSPTRSNGLQAMVKQVKLYALAYQARLSNGE